jgi:hypothetical protein
MNRISETMSHLKQSQLFRVCRNWSFLRAVSVSASASGKCRQLTQPSTFGPDEARAVEVVHRGRVLHRVALAVGAGNQLKSEIKAD